MANSETTVTFPFFCIDPVVPGPLKMEEKTHLPNICTEGTNGHCNIYRLNQPRGGFCENTTKKPYKLNFLARLITN